jgi:hypothetical protein
MQMLFELGFTRRQVSEMMGVGYGFAQNVYASTYPDRIRRRIQQLAAAGFNFSFTRDFGIEIEAFGISTATLERKLNEAGIETRYEGYNHTTRRYWKIVSDSSLNGQNTFELVSPILNGENGLEQLETVCRVLKENNAKINKSCGLHVHLDAKDFRTENWKKLYKNYMKIESTIESFMPESRRANNNSFCRSMKRNTSAARIERCNDLTEIEIVATNQNRYYKLNTRSYWRHETIEYRQHSGTIEFEKISNWLLFTARLTEYAKQGFELENDSIEETEKFLDENIVNYIRRRTEQLAS